MNLDNKEWSIIEGESVDSVMQWVDCDGVLVDTSSMIISVSLSKLSCSELLESHALSPISEVIDGVTYNIKVNFTPTLGSGQYHVEFRFESLDGTVIKTRSSEDLIIRPTIS